MSEKKTSILVREDAGSDVRIEKGIRFGPERSVKVQILNRKVEAIRIMGLNPDDVELYLDENKQIVCNTDCCSVPYFRIKTENPALRLVAIYYADGWFIEIDDYRLTKYSDEVFTGNRRVGLKLV